jgi:hypothetical protein
MGSFSWNTLADAKDGSDAPGRITCDDFLTIFGGRQGRVPKRLDSK